MFKRVHLPVARSLAAILLPAFVIPLTAADQKSDAKPDPNHPGYKQLPQKSRDGIGKEYMGREISFVMGHRGAGWLERKSREEEEKPALLIRSLKLKPGDNVADIGCGSGYFTRRLAKEIGPKGTVYAVDIQPEMLTILKAKMAEAGQDNYKPVLGTIEDPNLPENTIDLVLFVDVYHEFSHPYEMIQNISKGVKKGGRIVWVEYRKEDPKVKILPLHKMSVEQVKKEAAVHPLEYVETIDVLPQQHIIIFRKK